jgi:glutamine---fructose-6-phosphate transaminase (isomerizing)
MDKKSFLADILAQPKNLHSGLNNFPMEAINPLLSRFRAGDFTKIILAGHGSSYNSLYPAFLKISTQDVPVTLWQTAELLHYGINQIDAHTLLVLNSQSGESAEAKNLLGKIKKTSRACILGFTNYTKSTLGENCDYLVELNVGEEFGVAAGTYLNSVGLSLVFASLLCGENGQAVLGDFKSACDKMEQYLENYQEKLEEIDGILGDVQNIIVIGRGPSMAAALNGALNQKEAAWMFTEGMNAAEFRHGPLELADPNLTLIILEGDQKTSGYNFAVAEEVMSYGSKVIWIGNHPATSFKSIAIPIVNEAAIPLVELLPVQLIAQTLSSRKGLEAGKFRRIGKVVLKE